MSPEPKGFESINLSQRQRDEIKAILKAEGNEDPVVFVPAEDDEMDSGESEIWTSA